MSGRPVGRVLDALRDAGSVIEQVDAITWRSAPCLRCKRGALHLYDTDWHDGTPVAVLDCEADCDERDVARALGLRERDLRGGEVTAGPGDDRVVRFTAASDVRPEATRWAWEGRVPLGALTMLAGQQGLGKSTLSVELAARLSRGELPGDLRGERCATFIVSFEDNAASTIAPRLLAAGADLERVRLVTVERRDGADLVSLPGDVEAIAAGAREHGARLLVIDPVVGALTGETNSHRDSDIRRALAPLARLAEDADLAVLALIHWNKAAGTDAFLRVGGSTAFTAAPRSALAFGADPDDPDGDGRVLAHFKCNVGRKQPSLAYRVEGREIHGGDGERIETSRVVELGEHAASASDLLATSTGDERSELDDAREFLLAELGDGPRLVEEIKRAAREAGHADRTLRRAKSAEGVESRREGFGPGGAWVWALPAIGGQAVEEHDSAPDVDTYAKTPSVLEIRAAEPRPEPHRCPVQREGHLCGANAAEVPDHLLAEVPDHLLADALPGRACGCGGPLADADTDGRATCVRCGRRTA